MVTMSQRIAELRAQKGLSCPALSTALGFPKNAIEKFEAGRQTPSKEQQEKMAAYFGVSLFYLKGESNDPTQQENWMNVSFQDEEPAPAPRRTPKPAVQIKQTAPDDSPMFDAFLRSKSFQTMVRSTVLEVLRSPDGQELLAQAVRREIKKMR